MKTKFHMFIDYIAKIFYTISLLNDGIWRMNHLSLIFWEVYGLSFIDVQSKFIDR